MNAEKKEDAERELERFQKTFGAKYPEAVESLQREQGKLLTFFDFPADHWRHLRTTDVIESPFATVTFHNAFANGAEIRTKGLLMAFKLLDMAQLRRRRLNGASELPAVRAGATHIDGIRQETEELDAA